MTGRERFLAVLNGQKPDRLPVQVHSWMSYYLKTYLAGMTQYEAYDHFGMDPVIYTEPKLVYDQKDFDKWEITHIDHETVNGVQQWQEVIKTPGGVLTQAGACNKYTQWTTEHLIKNERDFELWNKYIPLPVTMDWEPVIAAKNKIGSNGIARGCGFHFGQSGAWQSFCCLFDTEPAIMAALDNPDWVEYALQSINQKTISVIERSGKIVFDLVETGGGAGSSTVISPDLHRRFCLPFDKKLHDTIHAAGSKVVYHLCGGVMPLLEIVAQNGADGLETMTPLSMGGDCDLADAYKRVGKKLFFIGGFDQNCGFENGKPALIREMVLELFRCCPGGGYICSPSDHFFSGEPSNIKAFADAARDCTY